MTRIVRTICASLSCALLFAVGLSATAAAIEPPPEVQRDIVATYQGTLVWADGYKDLPFNCPPGKIFAAADRQYGNGTSGWIVVQEPLWGGRSVTISNWSFTEQRFDIRIRCRSWME